MKALEFSTILQSTPVKLDGVDFLLSELTGKERDAYLTKNSERLETDDAGKVTKIRTFDGHQGELISFALKTKSGDAVPLAVIQAWPASVQEGLYDAASELSQLGSYRAKKAKND